MKCLSKFNWFFKMSIVCLSFSPVGEAWAGESGKNIVERLEDMRIQSQRITKDYLYINQGVRVEQSKTQLKESMAKLDEDLEYLNSRLKSEENKNLLMFLTFTRDELKDVMRENYSKENGALVMDFGESLLEGAESMIKNQTQSKRKKKSLSLTLEGMILNLERATKYYIAFQAGFKDHNNIKQMNAAMSDYEDGVSQLKMNRRFANTNAKEIKKITKYWRISKNFYSNVKKGDLPLIVFVSSDQMEKSLHRMVQTDRAVLASSE